MKINSPSHLSDTQLEAELMRLARCEREATVQLIAHLMEFDTRQLYLGAGFSSLFVYCCEVLRLSEHETYNRIEVARVARRFPLILDLLADGSLNQTTVRFLAPHLTAANCAEVLAPASHMEFHHVDPHVLRGEATVDGIELRCRAHNAYEARLYFGPRPGGSEDMVKEPRAQYGSLAGSRTRSGTRTPQRATPRPAGMKRRHNPGFPVTESRTW